MQHTGWGINLGIPRGPAREINIGPPRAPMSLTMGQSGGASLDPSRYTLGVQGPDPDIGIKVIEQILQILGQEAGPQVAAELLQDPEGIAMLKNLIAMVTQQQAGAAGQTGFQKFGPSIAAGAGTAMLQSLQTGQGTPDRFQMLGPGHYATIPGQEPRGMLENLLVAGMGGLQGYLGKQQQLETQDLARTKLLGGLGERLGVLEQGQATQRVALSKERRLTEAPVHNIGKLAETLARAYDIDMEAPGAKKTVMDAAIKLDIKLRKAGRTEITIGAEAAKVRVREETKDLVDARNYFKGQSTKDAVAAIKRKLGPMLSGITFVAAADGDQESLDQLAQLYRDEYKAQVLDRFPGAILERRTIKGKSILGWWIDGDLLVDLTAKDLD